MDKQSKKTIILKGIIKENPLFVTLLGLCPALATTTSVESALGMGLLFMFDIILVRTLHSTFLQLLQM